MVKRFEGDGDEGDEGGDVAVAAVVDDDVNDCVAEPTWKAAWPTKIEEDTCWISRQNRSLDVAVAVVAVAAERESCVAACGVVDHR